MFDNLDFDHIFDSALLDKHFKQVYILLIVLIISISKLKDYYIYIFFIKIVKARFVT